MPQIVPASELVGEALERPRTPLPKVAGARGGRRGPARLYAFPADHWPKLRSTNPLERVNREIGRRYLSNHSLETLLDPNNPDKQREETRELTAARAADDHTDELHHGLRT